MGNRAKKTTIALLSLIAVSVLFGCATLREREAPPDWEYVVRVSERDETIRHGELRFKGEPIEPVFSAVVIEDAKFTYVLRTADEPFRGYRRVEQFTQPDAHAKVEPFSHDLARGWYLAEFGDRRAGTPEGWVWVRRENVEAYVDQTRLREFASHHRLNQIETPKVETRVQVQLQYTIRL